MLTGSAATLLAVSPAHARQPSVTAVVAACGEDVPITDAACVKQFEDWQTKEHAWRRYRLSFGNYAVYRGVRYPVEKRPEPPAWIQAFCEQQIAHQAATTASLVCTAYDDYLRYDWTEHAGGPLAAVNQVARAATGPSPEYGGFGDYLLKNLHYDGGWTNSQYGSRVYGLFGTHLTLAHAGRLYFWGPPGLMVLRRPDGRVEVKATWGVDIFIVDVPLPLGPGARLPLFFSIAKAFGSLEEKAHQNKVNAGLDMIGFSVTLRR